MKNTAKQSDLQSQEEQLNIVQDKKTVLRLSSGRRIRIGWIRPDTQDKIDELFVEYERMKKGVDENDPKSVANGNAETRRFYSKTAAAILMNNYWGLKLLWWLKWRLIHHFWKMNGDDYLMIVSEAKKKAAEQSYYLAMAFLMTMPEVWTIMTKKEAGVFRRELESERERQS